MTRNMDLPRFWYVWNQPFEMTINNHFLILKLLNFVIFTVLEFFFICGCHLRRWLRYVSMDLGDELHGVIQVVVLTIVLFWIFFKRVQLSFVWWCVGPHALGKTFIGWSSIPSWRFQNWFFDSEHLFRNFHLKYSLTLLCMCELNSHFL